MPFKKGCTKPAGSGRKKNTPNKVTADLKIAIKNLLESYVSSGLLDSDFAHIDPEKRVLYMEKFANYIIPKQQSVSVTGDEQKPLTIEDKLKALSQQ